MEGEKYIYKWCSVSELDKINFKPKFMTNILKNIPNNIIHITEDEIKDKIVEREGFEI